MNAMARPQTVLIVEDDGDIGEVMTVLVQQQGYLGIAVTTATEALDLLQRIEACIILLDIAMPDMDGYEFRRQQLADARIAHIPVVVVSATGLGDEAKARAMGMRFFRKPVVDFDLLLDAIREYCGP